jgi:hypothetical protein
MFNGDAIGISSYVWVGFGSIDTLLTFDEDAD